jgi:hypothetical protein
MELDGVELVEGFPPIEVRCGGETHTVVAADGPDGAFTVDCVDHHGGSLVVAVLGGKKTACHRMVDELTDTSARLGIPLRETFEWYAHKFTWTTMQAWYRYGGPRTAAGWVEAGVTPLKVRLLHAMGIMDVAEYLHWQDACQYGADMDFKVIREYIDHGVESGEEALAWRRAGLRRPAQLAVWKSRGVDTPEKLAKRLAKDRSTPALAGAHR